MTIDQLNRAQGLLSVAQGALRDLANQVEGSADHERGLRLSDEIGRLLAEIGTADRIDPALA